MMTVNQLAARLGVTRQIVARYAAEGRIEGAQRFGRQWMFPDGATVARKQSTFRKIGKATGEAA